jgi:hypothetical protein
MRAPLERTDTQGELASARMALRRMTLCSATDKKVLAGSERSSKVPVEVPMVRKQKRMGRPRKGEELMEYRVSTVLTKQEKDALDRIADDKRWSMATLIRELLEKNYPEAFPQEKK